MAYHLPPDYYPQSFSWREELCNGRNILPNVTQQIEGTCYSHALVKSIEARLRVHLASQNIPSTFDNELNVVQTWNTDAELSIQQVVDGLDPEMKGFTCINFLEWMRRVPGRLTTTFFYPHRIAAGQRSANVVMVPDGEVEFKIENSELLDVILKSLRKDGPMIATFNCGYKDWDMRGKTIYQQVGRERESEEVGEERESENHSVMIIGYDLKIANGVFIYQNSYGKDFGIGGYGLCGFDVPDLFEMYNVFLQKRG